MSRDVSVRSWSRREFWAAAALTAPAYCWLALHLIGSTPFDTFVGFSLLVVVLLVALGATSTDLRACMYGVAVGIVVSFGALTALAFIEISQTPIG